MKTAQSSATIPDVKINVGICPNCQEPVKIDSQEISRLAGKIGRKARKTAGAKPKQMRPCPFCRLPFSAVDLRLHKPRCPKKPPGKVGKPRDPAIDKKYAEKLKTATKKRI